MLKVDRLSVGYGPVQVLFDVSLATEAGSCLGVLGPNGAGKTTLLRTISGFLKPLAGSIEIEGRAIAGRAPHDIVREGLSQVLQGRQVLGPMSVRDNLLLGGHLTLAKHGRRAVLESLEQIYAMFPILRERAQQQASSLSGGEQQMLAIGRAMMSRPRVLLLDEPSMGLAPLVVKQICAALQAIKRTGIAMVLIEQNPDFAFELADRCAILESGHLVLEGPTDILRNHAQMADLYLGGSL